MPMFVSLSSLRSWLACTKQDKSILAEAMLPTEVQIDDDRRYDKSLSIVWLRVGKKFNINYVYNGNSNCKNTKRNGLALKTTYAHLLVGDSPMKTNGHVWQRSEESGHQSGR